MASAQRQSEASKDGSAASFPADEKVGDNAVDYSEDSHDEERSASGQGQEGTLHSAVARLLAIEEVCATFVKSKGKHEEAESQQGTMEVNTAPVLNSTMALRQTDIMRLVENKDFRLKLPNIGHNPQRSGQEEEYLNDYGDTLAGYTSPGGSIRVHKEMMRLVFYAVAAELPNKAVLKAKQDAYDQVMRQAEDVLGKQRQAYETQCQKMAREHESCMERMRLEDERMDARRGNESATRVH